MSGMYNRIEYKKKLTLARMSQVETREREREKWARGKSIQKHIRPPAMLSDFLKRIEQKIVRGRMLSVWMNRGGGEGAKKKRTYNNQVF